MKFLKKTFIIFLLITYFSQIFAQDYINFVASELEGFTTPRGGAFIDSINVLLKDSRQYASNVKYEKSTQILDRFQKKEIQCLLGASISLFKFYGIDEKDYIESSSFWSTRYVLFTNKKTSTINKLDDLKGKRIGVFRADLAVFKKFLPLDSNIVEVKTKRNLYKVLAEGKIDVILDAYPLLPKYASNVHFNSDLLLVEFRNSIICLKNPQNLKFIEYINSKLHEDSYKDKLKLVFDRYYN